MHEEKKEQQRIDLINIIKCFQILLFSPVVVYFFFFFLRWVSCPRRTIAGDLFFARKRFVVVFFLFFFRKRRKPAVDKFTIRFIRYHVVVCPFLHVAARCSRLSFVSVNSQHHLMTREFVVWILCAFSCFRCWRNELGVERKDNTFRSRSRVCYSVWFGLPLHWLTEMESRVQQYYY